MTTEKQIIWLSWHRPEDCKVLHELISPDMFYTKELGEIYSEIQKADYKPEALEIMMAKLKDIGVLDLHQAWFSVNAVSLKVALIDEWKKAKGTDVLNRANKALVDGRNYRDVLKEFDAIETKYEKKQSTLKDHFEAIAKDHAEGTTKGFPTGIKMLDKYTEQLKRGHFWIIAASTNTGKTTLSLQIVKRALLAGQKVDFISLEMSARQLLERMTWIHAAEKKIQFERAISQMIDVPLTVTEGVRTVDKLRAHIQNSNADIIVLDYMQLVRGDGSYYENATEAANLLQELAIEKMIPIIALSQVTKESYKAGASHTMDFKGSGAIAESADVAIEIYRDRDNESEIADVKLLLKKNRHGQTGEIRGVTFDTKSGCFLF